MTIRMKDIARDLGLSVVTVSKVLRDHPDIGEETRKRVLQRVKELDYEPDFLARIERGGEPALASRAIGERERRRARDERGREFRWRGNAFIDGSHRK